MRTTSIFAAAALVAGASAYVTPTADHLATYTVQQLNDMVTGLYGSDYGHLGLFDDAQYDIEVYMLNYTTGTAGASTPLADDLVPLSGLMAVPVTPMACDLAIFHHDVTTENSHVPSLAYTACSSTSNCYPSPSKATGAILGMLSSASMGYAAIAPDGVGYGNSEAEWTNFLQADLYAVSSINAAHALKLVLADLDEGTTLTGQLTLAGYGEGGYASLAVHREILDKSTWGSDFTVQASFPGAGRLALGDDFEDALQEPEDVTEPVYLMYMLFSYASKLSEGLEGAFGGKEGENIELWFSGIYDYDEIHAFMWADLEEEKEKQAEEYYNMDDYEKQNQDKDAEEKYRGTFLNLLSKEFFEALEYGTETELEVIIEANSLEKGWTATPQAPIRACHGVADERVLIRNSETAMKAINDNGGDFGLLELAEADCETHEECSALCLQHSLQMMSTKDTGASGKTTLHAAHWGALAGVIAVLAVIGAVVVYRNYGGNRYSTL